MVLCRCRSTRGKPTKLGLESANQTHVKPLASCIGEKESVRALNQPLATGIVCHPDTEQNRPYKTPWPCRGLNLGLLHHKRQFTSVPHYYFSKCHVQKEVRYEI